MKQDRWFAVNTNRGLRNFVRNIKSAGSAEVRLRKIQGAGPRYVSFRNIEYALISPQYINSFINGGKLSMRTEIERKFLVQGDAWRTDQGVHIRQGYLNRDKERTVRVRVAGGKAFLTIKGINRGASCAEFEYEIPVVDAEQLLKICEGPLIEKTRHAIVYAGMVWEIDEFHGANENLIVAEVELERNDQYFERPDWLGKEVTSDPRYFNSNLCINPL
jgi:adenylate cyclase